MARTDTPEALAAFIMRQHQYAAHQFFGWLLDDLLADLTQRRKSDPPPADAMPAIFDAAGIYARCAIESPFDDILGMVYQEIASHGQKQHMGQFFTPMAVARMMVRMMWQDNPAPKADGELYRVMEPSSGSGVMLLAMVREIIDMHGKDALQHCSFTAIDLDHYCARMTAAQLLGNFFLHQISVGELLVIHGNSLFPNGKSKVIIHAERADRVEARNELHLFHAVAKMRDLLSGEIFTADVEANREPIDVETIIHQEGASAIVLPPARGEQLKLF